MRCTARALSVAALAGVALGTPASAASADPAAEVSPGTVAPGGSVAVSVTCDALDGSAPATLQATSQAFDGGTVELKRISGTDKKAAGPAYRGSARIPSAENVEGAPDTAGPESDRTVDGTCPAAGGGEGGKGKEWSATFTVARESAGGDGNGGSASDSGGGKASDDGGTSEAGGGKGEASGGHQGGNGGGGGGTGGGGGGRTCIDPHSGWTEAGKTEPYAGESEAGKAEPEWDGTETGGLGEGGTDSGGLGDDGLDAGGMDTGGKDAGGMDAGGTGADGTGTGGADFGGTYSEGTDTEGTDTGGIAPEWDTGAGKTETEPHADATEPGWDGSGAHSGKGEPGADDCEGGAADQHGVRAGTGGTFTDSVPALVAGGVLIAGAFGGAVYRLRRRTPASQD
ncbi:hypothetical protein [Streptomyces coerulescens]|uniref:Secreted protein n=1 Tax=Streptomyces coerulescens TaxID=29304 RepID=A0ABW0CCY4_STRCD